MLTKRRKKLDTARAAPKVIAWLADERPHAEIAQEMKVTRQAVTSFAKRHAAEIAIEKSKLGDGVAAKVEAQIVGPSIAEKSVRIQYADVTTAEIMKWIATYGLVTTTEHHGEHETYIENKFNGDLVRSLVSLLRYVADEKGEIPKPGINISTGDTLNVNMLNLDTYSPEQKAAMLRLALRGLPSGH